MFFVAFDDFPKRKRAKVVICDDLENGNNSREMFVKELANNKNVVFVTKIELANDKVSFGVVLLYLAALCKKSLAMCISICYSQYLLIEKIQVQTYLVSAPNSDKRREQKRVLYPSWIRFLRGLEERLHDNK